MEEFMSRVEGRLLDLASSMQTNQGKEIIKTDEDKDYSSHAMIT